MTNRLFIIITLMEKETVVLQEKDILPLDAYDA